MKSNKLLLVNGITSILGGLLILYASSERWDWKIVDLVPKLVENYGLVVLISLLFLALSIVGMAHYSEDSRVNKTSHKLLFCASIVGFIPFLGNFADLLSIGGGALYLLDLPRFKSDDKAE